MAIIVSTNKFEDSIHSAGVYYNKLLFKQKTPKLHYCFLGEIDNYTEIEVVTYIIENKVEMLSKIYGEFSIIVFDEEDAKIYFANDRCGRKLLYLSTKNGFAISSDFWSAVKHDKYAENDLDENLVLTEIFFSSSSANTTFFKRLKTLANASFGNYKNGVLAISKYWNFSFFENNLSQDDKYDAIDAEFKRSFSCIKRHNPSINRYGLGLSGGIDSRIIPYYAALENMAVYPFIIGKERPHHFLLSNDHKSAIEIATYYKLSLTALDPDSMAYHMRNEADIVFSPFCGSQIFKIPDFSLVEFDVLLTGASGFIVGSSPFYSENRWGGFLNSVIARQADFQIKRPFYKIKKALNYILSTQFDITKRTIDDADGIFLETSLDSFMQFFIAMLPKYENMSDTEKLMNYAISVLGQRNGGGAFESFLNQKKAYSPYLTGMLDVVSTWTEDELYDRTIFENFVKYRLPFLSNIRSQDYKTAIGVDQVSLWKKMLSVSEYIIRGQGVMNYEQKACAKPFRQFVNDYLNQKSWIAGILNIRKIYNLTLKKQLDSSVLTNIIKIDKLISMLSLKIDRK